MIAPTHAEGKIINEAVRQELKARGRIEKQAKSINVLESLNLTVAQKSDRAQYTKGDVIQPHQNIKGGFVAGQRYEVKEVNHKNVVVTTDKGIDLKLPTIHGDRYEVFTSKNLEIAKGEHVRITRNGKASKSKGQRLYNGQKLYRPGFYQRGAYQT